MSATHNIEYLGGGFEDDAPPISKEIYDILKLVVAEWESDPMSVQCFDLRIVERAKKACTEWEQCYPQRPTRIGPFDAAARARRRSGYTPAKG